MAQVPYQPYPTAQPTGSGTPRIGVDTPGAAFGENIGRAVEGLGTSLERSGNELFTRAIAIKELENETIARDADTKYMIAAGQMHADFSTKEGLNAGPAALTKYSSDLRSTYADIRNSLPNDDARRRYDASALSVMSRSIFNGAGHSAQQMKVAANGAADANIDAALNDVYHDPKSDGVTEDARTRIRSALQTKAGLHGWTQDQFTDQTSRTESKVLAHRITGLAREQPFEAEKMFEENKDRLHGEDLERVENSVRGQIRTTGARNIVTKVNADLHDPDMEDHRGLEDRIQDGREAAKKLAPQDELLGAYVDQAIAADYNRWKAGQRDTEFENKQVIEGALIGNYGKIPVSVDDIKAAGPEVEAAWQSLKPSQQRKYLNTMSNIARIGDRIPPAESLGVRQKYVGMAQTDPVAFLDSDPLSDKGMNIVDKKYLLNLQGQIKKNAQQDPRLTRALQILGPDMNAAGISKSANPTQFYQFVGAMQDQLEAWQAENKRSPKPEEVRQIGSRLMQETGTSFGLIWNSRVPFFEGDVPQEVKSKVKEDIIGAGGVEPTDEQIRRAYIRQQYKKLHSGPSKPSE